MADLSGRCRCGAVAWRAVRSPFREVLCHCRDCRAAAGGTPVGWIGFAKPAVTWTGARHFRATAPGVTRGACPACGTALSYMCTRWPGELHVAAATLDDPAAFAAEAHLHCAEAAEPGAADMHPRHAGRGPADLPRLRGRGR